MIAVDLPGDDETAVLGSYAELVDAIGSRSDVVLVAGSLGGFTAPLVCERVSVRELVLVNEKIPEPGETSVEWWLIRVPWRRVMRWHASLDTVIAGRDPHVKNMSGDEVVALRLYSL